MAKKTEDKLNYKQAVRSLKEQGPGRLYLLWGPEDYLREYYVGELKKLCLPDGEESFSLKRMNGPELDPQELQQAIDAVPFLSERSFVELRGIDLNHIKDADKIQAVLSDIPDYCTVAFIQSADFEPDGRLKLIKGLRNLGQEIQFTRQNQGDLINWLAKRFAALGTPEDRLVVTGDCKFDLPLDDENGTPLSSDHLFMDGKAIFDFTSDVVPPMIEETLQKNNLAADDVDLYVFHQANKYMINYLRKLMEIDKDKFYVFMEKVGNTVSSTIPIALCEAKKEGRLHGNVVLAGFGVGLSYGATIIRCE